MIATDALYDWRHAARQMLDQGQPIEVTAIDRVTHQPVGPTSRTSLLALPDDGLVTALPNHRDTVQSMRHTHHATLLLVEAGVRLECVVRIEAAFRHQLNEQTQVWALRMSEPLEVHSAQRRAFFRAITAHLKLMVTMQPLAETPLHTGVEIPDGPSFKAMMSNISGGGLGVIVPQRARDMIQDYGRYRTSVLLPTHDEPLCVAVKHVHLHENDDGTQYMGLAFNFADAAERHRVEDCICRFTTWLQRQELALQH